MPRRIKCKFCNRLFKDQDAYAAHLESKHSDMIPPDMDGYQFYYYLKTGKTEGKSSEKYSGFRGSSTGSSRIRDPGETAG